MAVRIVLPFASLVSYKQTLLRRSGRLLMAGRAPAGGTGSIRPMSISREAVARRPDHPVAFRTPRETAPWKRWLVYSPAARATIFIAVAGALMALLRLLFVSLGWADPAAPRWRAAAQLLGAVVPTVTAYLFLCRVVERRWPAELLRRGLLRELALGAAAGTLLISAVVAILWLAGAYSVTGTTAAEGVWRWILVGGLAAAIAEELVLRGVCFRLVEEGLGTWAALAVSSLVFGLLHLGNPSASGWSALAIAVEAGLLLGLLYHVTRSLPLCIGVHMGWNAAQGSLYGVAVSGVSTPAWLVSERRGPEWLTGGALGAEGSVVAVAVSLLVSLALLALAVRRGSLLAPPFLQELSPAGEADVRAQGSEYSQGPAGTPGDRRFSP